MSKGLSLFEKRRRRNRTALRARAGTPSAAVACIVRASTSTRRSSTTRPAARSPPPRRWQGMRARPSNVAAATEVGKRVAEAAKAAGVTQVVFDRGGFLFHGRVKALAEAAREAGLEF